MTSVFPHIIKKLGTLVTEAVRKPASVVSMKKEKKDTHWSPAMYAYRLEMMGEENKKKKREIDAYILSALPCQNHTHAITQVQSP
jgi:hypothetical protein